MTITVRPAVPEDALAILEPTAACDDIRVTADDMTDHIKKRSRFAFYHQLGYRLATIPMQHPLIDHSTATLRGVSVD